MFDKIKLKNIFNTNDLLKIINELEKYIVEVSDKQNFLDYIEFELIFNKINRNESDDHEGGIMKGAYINRKNLLNQLKDWTNKKRELIKIEELKQSKIITNFKTNITQTELIELVKALIENGTITGKQKDIINDFSNFFNIEVNNPDKLITDLKKRNNGSETLFLDKLKTSLFNHFTKENKR